MQLLQAILLLAACLGISEGLRYLGGDIVLGNSRLRNWLKDLFEREDRVPTLADEDKRYVFDETITSSLSSVPKYLFSALLSGLNVLPSEAALKKGSQNGRRVQYSSYREIPLNWEAGLLVDSHAHFASITRSTIDRLVESVSLRTNEDILQQGSLRLYRFELNAEDALKVNEEMLAQANSRIEQDGIKVSNAGGYHSKTDCFESGANAKFARLCEVAVDIAEADDSTFGGGERRLLQKSENSEAWINVNSHGCWNSLHTHTGSSWSGVYWARVPSNDVSSGGDLLLKPTPHITETKGLSEIESLRLMIRDEIRNCAALGCCDYIRVKPVVSSLLLFPSYLQHAVVPLFVSEVHRASSTGERVSFAFNFAEL